MITKGQKISTICADTPRAEVVQKPPIPTSTTMRTTKINTLLATALLALTIEVQAEVLQGEVVGVADGDTITVLDASKVQHKVRLAGIDAPEKAQAYGQASKQALSDSVYNKRVQVEWQKLDRYQRIVGKVYINGADANIKQLTRGLAWHYKKYSNEQSPADAVAYADAEKTAQAGRVGLWADALAVQPWDWRKQKKKRADTQP